MPHARCLTVCSHHRSAMSCGICCPPVRLVVAAKRINFGLCSLSLSLSLRSTDMLRAILTQRRAISARWSVWKLAVMYVGDLMPPMFSIIQ